MQRRLEVWTVVIGLLLGWSPATTLLTAGEPAPVIKLPLVTLAPSEERDVPARDEGSLKALHVRIGQTVDSGTLLAELDDAEAVAEQAEARIKLKLAEEVARDDSAVRLAEKARLVSAAEYERALSANREFPGSVSQSRLDELRLRKEEAEIRIEQMRFERQANALRRDLQQVQLTAFDARLAKRRITAPISGEIVQVQHESGEWVKPGDIVFRIIRRDRLRVEGFLNASALQYDYAESEVELSVSMPGVSRPRTYSGQIVFVSPEIETTDGRVRFRAEIENSDGRLMPGARGELTILGKPAATPRPETE